MSRLVQCTRCKITKELERGEKLPDDWDYVWDDCELCRDCFTDLNKFLAGEAIPAITSHPPESGAASQSPVTGHQT
jgi:hypothetical protein